MTLHVWTARVPTYHGLDRLDITRGGADWGRRRGVPSGGEPFAPSRDLLSRIQMTRRGDPDGLEWPEYERLYRQEMEESRAKAPWHWSALLKRDQVTLLCFCFGQECHRFLLARILQSLGAVSRGER